MRVIATRASGREGPDFVSHVGLPDEMLKLLPEADVVVDTLPLTEQTRTEFRCALIRGHEVWRVLHQCRTRRHVVTADLVNAFKENHLWAAQVSTSTGSRAVAAGSSAMAPAQRHHHTACFQRNLNSKRTGTGKIACENLRRYAAGERMLSVGGREARLLKHRVNPPDRA